MAADDVLPTVDAVQLQELVLSTESLSAFLDEVTALAAAGPARGLSCGLTVRTGEKRPYTISSSDAVANRLDEMQYRADEGPCLHALRTGEVVDFDAPESAARWGSFAEQAEAEGLRASLSLPMRTRDATVGALNLYLHGAGNGSEGFSEAERDRALRFARQATGVVALAVRLAEHERITADLHAALASRTTIDQALGILMGQQRCDADEAFDLLRRASQRRNVKLRKIAAELITEVTGKRPQPGPVLR